MEANSGVFQWDVNYVTWREFSKAVIGKRGHIWDKIISAHLVCGGLDFSCDFM
jgi:hypothetical protein